MAQYFPHEQLEVYGVALKRVFLGNSTCTEIRWKTADLGTLRNRPVQFRFSLDRGELFAFWVTDSATGASNGYIGAGGPGLSGARDS